MTKLPSLNCEKCSHTWTPRTEKPIKCPKCGHIIGARIYREEKKEAQRMVHTLVSNKI
jgi:Zn finger protein HypA/HybF involved in hydrogenase expression